MSSKKAFFFSLILFFLTFSVYSQKNSKNFKGTQITIKINFTKDSLIYLVGYYGERKVLIDSAFKEKKISDTFVFNLDSVLPSGIYLISNQRRMQLLEFVIDKSHIFTIETDTLDIINTVKVTGSPETVIFHEYVRGLTKLQYDIKNVRDSLNIAQKTKNIDGYNNLISKYKLLVSNITNYSKNYIEKYPNELFAKALKMNNEIVMPPLPLLPNGSGDSTWGWYYYKAHYWDNVDLTDERMLRTPIFFPKFKTFINELIIQHPDSLMIELDNFIEKTRPSKGMFKYMVSWLTNHYQTSNIVGFDAVFVHLVEKYFLTNQVDWITENDMRIITKRAGQLKPILIGEIIPEIIMPDTSGKFISNHKIDKKYTIMWFWDPDCTHCVEETPKLIKYYNKYKDTLNLEVFAVSLDKDFNRWKKYLRDNNISWLNVGGDKANIDYVTVFDVLTTPVIFVFDEKKRIILKNIPVENIFDILLRENSIPFEK